MKECDGNQLLENMTATHTQKRIGDLFSQNKQKRSKIGADWLIFVDARVLTRKLRMDGCLKDGHDQR